MVIRRLIMYLRRLLACVLLLTVVCHPAKTINANRQRRQHQSHQQKQQTSDFDHYRILEKDRTKNVVYVKSSVGQSNNWGLPIIKSHGHWKAGSTEKPAPLERAPQVDKVMVNEHFQTINNFNNSVYNVEKCSDTKYKKLKKQYGCRPRETIVHFIHSGGFKLSPSAVEVQRCDGMCEGYSKCVPTEKRTKTFYIRQIHKNQVSCGTIDVEEHVTCSCSCPERASQCKVPEQFYDHEECKCRCKPELIQNCPQKKKYDQQQCSCICRQRRKCSTGTDFDENTCRCIKHKKTRMSN